MPGALFFPPCFSEWEVDGVGVAGPVGVSAASVTALMTTVSETAAGATVATGAVLETLEALEELVVELMVVVAYKESCELMSKHCYCHGFYSN